jgi:predicted Rossmann fold nucleotide-binding protein DprA/Smf involved in DNA uptake
MSGFGGRIILTYADAGWPNKLSERLGKTAPHKLDVIGPVNLLTVHKTALFCSARAPGDVILRAHDTARQLRDEGVTVVSGFHSPIEKDCLDILLRGEQAIIICLARAMEKIRLPSGWRSALDTGRLLILSPFKKRPTRPTVESARQRNELVAALADDVLIIHATPGGQIDKLSAMVNRWRIPTRKLISKAH